jgi:glutathione S-transferase
MAADYVEMAGVPELHRYAKILDVHLDGRELVACGRLTIADFQLASMAVDWRESEMLFEAFPNIVRWLDGHARIRAWADPWPATHSTD